MAAIDRTAYHRFKHSPTGHACYDREYANRFWRILVQTDRPVARIRTKHYNAPDN